MNAPRYVDRNIDGNKYKDKYVSFFLPPPSIAIFLEVPTILTINVDAYGLIRCM
jgi:hypothetical protein